MKKLIMYDIKILMDYGKEKELQIQKHLYLV